MSTIHDHAQQLAQEIADVAIKAIKEQGFIVGEELAEKIQQEIYFSIRLGR